MRVCATPKVNVEAFFYAMYFHRALEFFEKTRIYLMSESIVIKNKYIVCGFVYS